MASIEKYSEKSIVVRGDTKKYKEELKELGGKWNKFLTGGPGWIFSHKKEKEIRKILDSDEQDSDEQDSDEQDSDEQDSDEQDSDESEHKKQTVNLPIKLIGECNKYSQDINIPKTVTDIGKFCGYLRDNKVKDSKETFLKLPYVVQCLFLQHSWEILSKKSKHSDDSYRTAFYLFKLFRSKEFQAKPIYARYMKLKLLEKHYKKALDWNRKSPVTKIATKRTTSGKKYDKQGQRYEHPESETDPLYIFYTTLYKERPKSALAITWLTEHGVYEGKERDELVKKYNKLAEQKKLIR